MVIGYYNPTLKFLPTRSSYSKASVGLYSNKELERIKNRKEGLYAAVIGSSRSLGDSAANSILVCADNRAAEPRSLHVGKAN